MKMIKKSLEQAMANEPFPDFDEVARKWACHCLDTYTGKLLGAGLGISMALVAFTRLHPGPSIAQPQQRLIRPEEPDVFVP